MPPATVAPDMDRGRRIGKYEILTRLSMGGMAELFLAYTAGPGGFRKYVAVKQILPDIKKDESFVKMFLDEARITAAFNNANIGQVFDLGEQDGELYLAMEFIAGQNLEQVVKRATKREVVIPVGFAARAVRDSCLGLHYAHHFTDPSGKPAPVVHRDVSPKNVMVTYTGDVKMIDFGIAKAKNRLNRTQVGIVKGTSGYMSPEQVRNEPLDGRTDLFAAAVMLHELLTSQRLFTAPSDALMMMKIVEGEVQHPRNLNPKVSQALSDVVMKGLARKRENRWSTGKEFARAIEQACPELFDEDQVAEVMNGLFDDKIQTTRALLDLANTDDTGGMTRAVEALRTVDESAETGTPRPPKKGAAPKRATPAPREGLATPARGRSGKLPATAPVEEPEVDRDATIPPTNRKKGQPNRQAGQGARDSAMFSQSEAQTDQTSPPPPRTAPSARRDTQDIPVARVRGGPPSRRLPAAEAKKGGIGGVLFLVLFPLALSALIWAGWKGPLKDLGPAVAMREWVDLEINGPPPGPPPPDIRTVQPSGPKPQWVIDKEAAEAREKAEKLKQAEIEAQANDPENQKYLADLNAQIKQLNETEEQVRQLKIESRAGSAANAANTKRIDDLEKQIADMKAAIAEKEKKKPGKKKPADGIEVVTDARSARNADVGYLTLYTVNPSKVAVFEGATALGSTPIVKLPLDVGVHTLRIVDGDSLNRTLHVEIKRAGEVTDLKGVDVSSMPLMK